MKQLLTLLALCLGLGTANAQKINKKYFLKILEVPYSTIEDGDKILRELGCTEKDNSIPKYNDMLALYFRYNCSKIKNHDYVHFTVYYNQFLSMEKLLLDGNQYDEIIRIMEEHYVSLPEESNEKQKVYRSRNKYKDYRKNEDYLYLYVRKMDNNVRVDAVRRIGGITVDW